VTESLFQAVRCLSYRKTDELLVLERNNVVADASVKIWSGTHPKSAEFFSWLNGLGIHAAPGVKLPDYADGGVGRAYFVGKPIKVIKFTSDANEFHIANRVAGDLNGPARVISVKDLGEDVFVIAQEYASVDKNAPAKLKMAADYLQGGYIDQHPEVEHSGLPRDERTKTAIARSLTQKYGKGDPEIADYIVKLIDVLNNLFDKTGFLHDDAGPTNVGLAQDGKVILSDLGPNRNNLIDANSRQAKFAANLAQKSKF
jgi:hypothetical protein